MAIAIDNSAIWSAPNASGANTQAYTCTGSDLILIASVATGLITSMTYNGVAMTKLADNATTFLSYYYLQNPATGSNNIVVTRSGSPGATIDGDIMSFTGVLQGSNPFGTGQTNSGTSTTSLSNNYTTTQANSYIVDFLSTSGAPGAAPSPVTATGAGHISARYSYIGGGDQVGSGAGYTPTTSTGAYTIGYSWTVIGTPAAWAISYYELFPSIPFNGFYIALV